MQADAEAVLVYGYNLGGGARDWLVEEAEEYGQLHTSWYSTDDDSDFIAAAQRELRATALPPPNESATLDERRAHRKRAEEKIAVEFHCHGCLDDPQTLLIAQGSKYSVDNGETKVITPQMLITVHDTWDLKLKRALHMLGLTPTQRQPQWLLCAYSG